ncbi:MAG: matrixin family metalloprotease [Fimbriimonadaceae bacterium]|nr:matrixin family metalloprotease [Fimbriimonadaceae bacterium]
MPPRFRLAVFVALVQAILGGCEATPDRRSGRAAGALIATDSAVLAIVPLADPRSATVRAVHEALEAKYNVRVVVAAGQPMPKDAYYPPRKRYRADRIIESLAKRPEWRVIGVTDKDVSAAAHGVKDYGLMGLGYIGGRSCVVSSFRAKRHIGRVAVHEFGHTLGLDHCPTPKCLMRDGEGTGRNIIGSDRFCDECAKTIAKWLRRPVP